MFPTFGARTETDVSLTCVRLSDRLLGFDRLLTGSLTAYNVTELAGSRKITISVQKWQTAVRRLDITIYMKLRYAQAKSTLQSALFAGKPAEAADRKP